MSALNEDHESQTAEERFKQYLLDVGLLTEITPPLEQTELPERRQPAAVVGNPVSELVLKERR
jgi:hypothetical protein